MSAIQVKNVPPELHERLRRRARREGRSLSDYILSVLGRDLETPTLREWLEGLSEDEPVAGITGDEIADVIREGRAERDEQIAGALAAGH